MIYYTCINERKKGQEMNTKLVNLLVYVMNKLSAENNKVCVKDGAKERISPEHLRDLMCETFQNFYQALGQTEEGCIIPWKKLTPEIAREFRLTQYTSDDALAIKTAHVKTHNYSEDVEEKELEKIDNLRTMWLIPSYLYPVIPKDITVVTVNGDVLKNNGRLPIDSIYGYLSYGIQIPYQDLEETEHFE